MNTRKGLLKRLPVLLVAVVCGLVGCEKKQSAGEAVLDRTPDAVQITPAPGAQAGEAVVDRAPDADQITPAAGAQAGGAPKTTESPDAAPVINVSTTELDLGFIPTNEPGKGAITVKNVGKADLVVSDVKTSCGCTVPKIVKKLVPPGDETVIDVMVDPKRIYGFQSTKTLTIFSNDPNNPKVEVKVTAKIKPEFVLEPERVELGKHEKGEVAQQTVIMRQASDEELRLLDAQAQAAVTWLDVSFEERPKDQWKDPEKREYAIHVALKPNAPAGPLSTNVLLKPDLVRVNRYMLPVSATVTAFYTVLPPVVNLGPINPGKTIENVLRIAADQPFEIVNFQVVPPANNSHWISLTPHAQGAPNLFALDATIAEDLLPGAKTGVVELVIRGNDKEYTESIRVVGSVQPAGSEPVRPAFRELKPIRFPNPAAATAEEQQ